MKTVYVLRIKDPNNQTWNEPEFFRTCKERDRTASLCRCIGGLATHSYEEKKTEQEVAALFDLETDFIES